VLKRTNSCDKFSKSFLAEMLTRTITAADPAQAAASGRYWVACSNPVQGPIGGALHRGARRHIH